jgi:MFS family permease
MFKAIQYIGRPYTGFSKDTWKFLGAGFVNATGLTLTIYLTLYLNSLGVSLSKVGWTITLFSIGGLIGGYLGGWLSDKFSALTVCKLSLLISSGFIFLIALSKNYYILSGFVTLTGLFSSLFRPAFILALADQGKSVNLEKIIALRRVAINLGMSFGAAIFGFIASISYSFLFSIIGIMNILAFIILKKINDTGNINIAEKNAANKAPRNIGFYIVLVLMFSVSLIFNQTQTTYPLFIKNNLNYDVSFISCLFTLNGIVIAFLQMPISSYLTRINTNLTCALGTFLLSMGLSILSICSTKSGVIFSCILWTLGEIIFFPAILTLIIKLSGSKKGKSIGLYQLFFSFASFAAPTLGILSYGYDKNFVWYASGILGIVTTLYFLLSIKKTNDNFVKLTLENESL